MLKFISFILIMVSCKFTIAQTGASNKILANYDSTRKAMPREKLYVHIDKSTYTSQDTIWFKAYLVDASLGISSPISGLVYFDMVNPLGETIKTITMPTALGFTWGYFALNDVTYPSGNYTFRAYTNWMRNFGDTYLFKKKIKVINSLTSEISSSITKNTKTDLRKNVIETSTKKLALDIQFLPESGAWIANQEQRMALRVINQAGKGIEINGEVYDRDKKKLLDFKTNDKGMGFFYLSPKPDETYTARLKVTDNIYEENLPKIKPLGTAIHVSNRYISDSLNITLLSALPNQELIMIGQSRGLLCFSATFKANTSLKTIKVAKDLFPTGICQIILKDQNGRILNERNFFNDLKDQLSVKTTTKSLTYGLRDSIPIHLKVSDVLKHPIMGSFSVAVTDDKQVWKDTLNDANILSYLLLSSDLRGEIENPGYYFIQPNEKKHNELDALMLTQGWVSYDWDLTKKPSFKIEKDFTITGKVTNVLNKPSINNKLTLLAKNKTFFLMDTITNDKGEFTFKQFPVLDSASLIIQALNARGKKGTLGITVNEFSSPPFKVLKETNEKFVMDSTAQQLVATKNEAYQKSLASGISLKEVKIIGKRSILTSKNLNGPGEASQILDESDLANRAKVTLYDVLREKVKGFHDGYRKRSPKRDFFVNGDLARFIFDGVELDFFYDGDNSYSAVDQYYLFIKSYLDYYLAEDIKGIEVLSNGFSFRYKNKFKHPMDEARYAFIEITTKTGSGPFLKKAANIYLFKPNDYGNTKVFYSPKYSPEKKTNAAPDFRSTIYWNPNVMTNEKGEVDFHFFSADKKGTYTLWLEGMDNKGNFGLTTMKLKIN